MSTFLPPPSFTVPVTYEAGAEETAARGSYGPVIAMLAVVVVLAAAAVAAGRLCFGRRALGHDLEAWVERKCGPCVGVTRDTAKDEEGGGATVSVSAAAEQPPEGTTTQRGEASGGGGGS